MITIDLSGKQILITGALGAIAEHMVRKLAATGAMLLLTDIKSEDDAKRMLDVWRIPTASYRYFAADITDSNRVNSLVGHAFEQFGALDTVIGHAGGCGLHAFASLRRLMSRACRTHRFLPMLPPRQRWRILPGVWPSSMLPPAFELMWSRQETLRRVVH
jgi:NAD(P)-dependent dehydrogenase (short-subunit alcohol dehydrogenase family)